jgi:acyl-CoA reductase-like NAD-dependent aldehyde dehydrogenase
MPTQLSSTARGGAADGAIFAVIAPTSEGALAHVAAARAVDVDAAVEAACRSAGLPWGGLETSGTGREHGFAGSEGTTEEKTVTITV